MARRPFYDRLSERVQELTMLEGFDHLLAAATEKNTFHNSEDLKSYITEGALVNVNTFGSGVFSIPSGEYMVWLTDAGHTMLVPTDQLSKTPDVFEHSEHGFEISTRDMLKTFTGFGRTLTEADEEDRDYEERDDEEEYQREKPEPKQEAEPSNEKFELAVDASTVDRTPILKAMEDQHYTVTELARKCGVDTPAISRILREPQPGPGDPGGRNPSIELAAKICAVLSMDPRSAFPDIFSKKPKLDSKSAGDREKRDRGSL